MNEKLFLKSFKIERLFGKFDVFIPFESNTNIFIGENGLGKTTILNCLNYVLQADSESLALIDFVTIELILGNGKKIKINKADLFTSEKYSDNEYLQSSLNGKEDIEYRIMFEFYKFEEKNKNVREHKDELYMYIRKLFNIMITKNRFERLLNNYESIDNEVFKNNWEFKIEDYMKRVDSIIYLPTYRRIEADFKKYFEPSTDREGGYYQKKSTKNLSYLQFGMDDVQKAITEVCFELKNNTNEGFKEMTTNLLKNYIDIIDGTGKRVDFKKINIKSEELEIIFSRLADKISTEVKERIIELVIDKSDEKDKEYRYLLSIINDLINIYEKNKQIDDNLENFERVCNGYLVNNIVRYDKLRIECNVLTKIAEEEIELKKLSSGEKQILSLFSKLYLSKCRNSIVLFDEPELSLSILWQRNLIPDILKSGRCAFLIAITHSPFIFDNDYFENAIDIKNFITLTSKKESKYGL